MNFIKKFIMLGVVLTILSCSFEIEKPLPQSDLSIATFNLKAENNAIDKVAETIASLNADIVIINEVNKGFVAKEDFFKTKGYKVFLFTKIIYDEASNAKYSLGCLIKDNIEFLGKEESMFSYLNNLPNSKTKVFICRVKVKDKFISLIGANPSKYRREIVKNILTNIENGKLKKDFFVEGAGKTGDYVFFAGDFNMLPSDPQIAQMKNAGFKDSHKSDKNRTNMTWNNIARIDYIFYPNEIINNYAGTFSIPGSDHRGVVAGFNF